MDLGGFKKFLGPAGREYNDAELRELKREMEETANLLLELYIEKKRRKELPDSNDCSDPGSNLT